MVRRSRSERDLDDISRNHDGLSRLLATARSLERLEAPLKALLPGSMREHIGLACIEDETLVLSASSPAWASRARLMADDLLREANRHLDDRLRQARVIVAPKLR